MKVAVPAALGAPALLALALSNAHAQSTEARLPTAVVTPSRIVQSLEDALPSTTVITRAEIDRWQLSDLVGALSREAGVQFAQSGGPGSAASLFVRGANSSQVLVLVDGVPLNAAVGGAASLGGIALDTVERIEIARGNLSSLYGSAAIGGVVQVFTRGAGAPGASLLVEGGQGGNVNGGASASTDLGGLRLGASIGARRSDQFSAIDAARVIPGAVRAGGQPRSRRQREHVRFDRGDLPHPGRDAVRGQCLGQHQPHRLRQHRGRTDGDPRGALDDQGVERARAHAADAGVGVAAAGRGDEGPQPQHAAAIPVVQQRRVRVDEPPGELDQRGRRERNASRRSSGWSTCSSAARRRPSTRTSRNALTEFSRDVTSVWGGVNGRTERQLVQVNVRAGQVLGCRLRHHGTRVVRLQADARMADHRAGLQRVPCAELQRPLLPVLRQSAARTREVAQRRTRPALRGRAEPRCAPRCTAPTRAI